MKLRLALKQALEILLLQEELLVPGNTLDITFIAEKTSGFDAFK